MCMKDVRMGRAKVATSIGATAVPSGDTTLFARANPNRAGLVVSADFGEGARTADVAVVMVGDAAGPAVGALSPGTPHWSGRVEELGAGLLGDVYVKARGANSTTVYVTELVWLSDPEDA